MSFLIEKTLGVTAEEILAKRHNLFMGVSDTPWFREGDRLEQLLEWALERTSASLLVMAPGRLYAANYFHIDKRGRAVALRQGFEMEDGFRRRIQAVLSGHSHAHPVSVVGYDFLHTTDFIRRKEALFRAFSIQGEFYRRVIEVAKEYLGARGRSAHDLRAEAVAVYQLEELPIFIAPVRTIDSSVLHSAVVYPGFGRFDELAYDLATSDKFPEIPAWFKLEKPMGIVSVKGNWLSL
jgi:tRNA-dependent cyclodipeptide synthase